MLLQRGEILAKSICPSSLLRTDHQEERLSFPETSLEKETVLCLTPIRAVRVLEERGQSHKCWGLKPSSWQVALPWSPAWRGVPPAVPTTSPSLPSALHPPPCRSPHRPQGEGTPDEVFIIHEPPALWSLTLFPCPFGPYRCFHH